MHVKELSTSPAQRARRDRDCWGAGPCPQETANPSPKDAFRAWAGTSLLQWQ